MNPDLKEQPKDGEKGGKKKKRALSKRISEMKTKARRNLRNVSLLTLFLIMLLMMMRCGLTKVSLYRRLGSRPTFALLSHTSL